MADDSGFSDYYDEESRRLGTSGYTGYDPSNVGTFVDVFTGDSDRQQQAQNQARERRAQLLWESLRETAPGVDDLSVDYGQLGTTDEYGDLLGGPSQLEGFGTSADQTAALDALRDLSRGGFTDSDRAMMRATRTSNAQALGSQNAAIRQQMEARGMGGSGASLAAQLGGGQALANANSLAGAHQMATAEQRAMAALAGYTSQANALQQQEMARRNALDAYNQRGVDWRRQRSAGNVGLQGQTNQSRAAAQQQAYANRAQTVAGQTGQQLGWASQTSQDQQNAMRGPQATLAAVGSGVEGIAKGIGGGMG